ncbi:hypothetical protein [Terriglobus saanensis]|uniref:hypothetical protein n=1 Tax=Terriglobus saanensis TaxID=870903 RepID=UPI0001E50EE3|nr:hypothetical protein [Terriglobus saanensis]
MSGAMVSPVEKSERLSSIDILRGVALLGILVANIDTFGNPEPVHDIPIGTPIDNFAGPHAHLNLALLFVKWMFFEGKMRGLFSMLFGAGLPVIAMAEKRSLRELLMNTTCRTGFFLVGEITRSTR